VGYVLIMTNKNRVMVGFVSLLLSILDRGRRAAIRAHHRIRIASSAIADDSLKNLADRETAAPFKLDPSNFRDAKVLNDLFDILEGVYGEEAQIYFQRYLKLWPIYRRLKNEGVNVRISLGRFRQQPLLIINGKVYPIRL
jgi:hypothetical protein